MLFRSVELAEEGLGLVVDDKESRVLGHSAADGHGDALKVEVGEREAGAEEGGGPTRQRPLTPSPLKVWIMQSNGPLNRIGWSSG